MCVAFMAEDMDLLHLYLVSPIKCFLSWSFSSVSWFLLSYSHFIHFINLIPFLEYGLFAQNSYEQQIAKNSSRFTSPNYLFLQLSIFQKLRLLLIGVHLYLEAEHILSSCNNCTCHSEHDQVSSHHWSGVWSVSHLPLINCERNVNKRFC